MSSQPNFLETDSSIMENNLKFVKNEMEEEIENIFGGALPQRPTETDYKIVKPNPGMCIKCFKLNTNEKFFINLCQTDGIPSPEDITEDELTDILNSGEPSSYKIPMSISEPRITTDKSGNHVDVCDIAINPLFYQKCCTTLLFRDFLIAIILEAISDKYNVQVDPKEWIVLKNRKFMGQLITHRIQNRDIKTVYDSYKNKNLLENENMNGKKLIEEINPSETRKLKKIKQNISIEKSNDKNYKTDSIKELISMANSQMPEYKFAGKLQNFSVNEIFAEFFLPKCISANEITVDIGEDRILIESMKHGYLFDKFIEYSIDQDKVVAKFDKATRMLQISMPIISAN